MNITTQRNISKINDYIAKIYPAEKSARGNGISRPSPQAIKAGLAYLTLVSGSKQTRQIASVMFGERWCDSSNRLNSWVAQGRSLLIQHAPDALPQHAAYNMSLRLKGARGGKL